MIYSTYGKLTGRLNQHMRHSKGLNGIDDIAKALVMRDVLLYTWPIIGRPRHVMLNDDDKILSALAIKTGCPELARAIPNPG